MTSCGDLRMLFRVRRPGRGAASAIWCAAVRWRARWACVRSSRCAADRESIETAVALGCDVVDGSARRVLLALQPDVLIVDDPIAADATPLDPRGAPRRLPGRQHSRSRSSAASTPISSSTAASRGTHAPEHGLTLRRSAIRRARSRRSRRRSVPASGGRQRARSRTRCSSRSAAVRVPSWRTTSPRRSSRRILRPGFVSPAASPGISREASGARSPGSARHEAFTRKWRRASVAVVGGGVSLYEACAHGVAAVGVPVVAAQRPTVAAFVAWGRARRDARAASTPQSVAAECAELLTDAAMRRHMARMGSG